MPRKTVRVAVWEYRNAEGKRRRAFFGDSIDFTEEEIERGTAMGVFAAADPAPVVDDRPAKVEPKTKPQKVAEQKSSSSSEATVRRPVNTALKAEWVAYAKSRGVDAEVAENASRDELRRMLA